VLYAVGHITPIADKFCKYSEMQRRYTIITMHLYVFLDDYQRVVAQALNPMELYMCKYCSVALLLSKLAPFFDVVGGGGGFRKCRFNAKCV
jgi:hypothetical protein